MNFFLKKNSFFLDFFSQNVIKGPFKLYFMCNIIKFYNISFFFNLLRLSNKYNFRISFISSMLLSYYFFLVYQSANILLFFFYDFFKFHSYKLHGNFKKYLLFLLKNTSMHALHSFGFKGFFIKLKGKITGRAGDRKKTFFYKIGKFSITNTKNIYELFYKQLHSKTGCTGCTIILVRL